MAQVITFKTKNYFEGVIHLLGFALGLAAILLIVVKWWLTIILGFFAVIIIFTSYQIRIHVETKEIEDFLFVLGLQTQHEKIQYSQLEYIYITKSKFTQQMHHKSLSSSISGELFTAYLKTDAGNIYLGERKNLSKLKNSLRPLLQGLNLDLKEPKE